LFKFAHGLSPVFDFLVGAAAGQCFEFALDAAEGTVYIRECFVDLALEVADDFEEFGGGAVVAVVDFVEFGAEAGFGGEEIRMADVVDEFLVYGRAARKAFDYGDDAGDERNKEGNSDKDIHYRDVLIDWHCASVFRAPSNGSEHRGCAGEIRGAVKEKA
jgi:hypothetical protein